MSQPLRVLLVEDSEQDAFLILRALQNGGFQPECKRVDTPQEMAAALTAGAWDLVISDYGMPKFSGPAALELLRGSGLDVPFIVVSGTIGEDLAVSLMKAGAHDYLMKGQLTRLAPAVKRELQEAEQRRQRRQAESSLRESEERFRQLAEHSSEGFWFVALHPQRILYVSPAVEKIWGLPATSFYEDPRVGLAAIHSDDQTRVLQAWEACLQGQSPRFEAEYRVLRPDGSVRWVLDHGTPILHEAGGIVRVSGVARDISERKQVESQMLRTQRLESIGTLASGVAHDLNNAFAPIMMTAELLRLEFPEKATRYLELIQASARRGADLVRQLLTFAKGAEGERLLLQPRHLFNEMEKLIHGTFPKNIQLQVNHANNLRTIFGDVTQLHQVLLNLCVNARDAMPNGGTLTLKTENMEIDPVYVGSVPEARPGHYVVWRIMDTGTGIPPEVLDRIFEPFFTTKGPDKGTGLGLSTVLGIVKGHGGFVRVYSVPGQGSTFAIYLPAAGESTSDPAVVIKTKTTFRGNGETILVVDDEAGVREVTRAVLMAFNFKVLTAADGIAALVQVSEHRDELRAVITDCHMPHMAGLDFVRVLRARLPQSGIIVASGQMEEQEAMEFKKLGVQAVLNKPFRREDLIDALKVVFQK